MKCLLFNVVFSTECCLIIRIYRMMRSKRSSFSYFRSTHPVSKINNNWKQNILFSNLFYCRDLPEISVAVLAIARSCLQCSRSQIAGVCRASGSKSAYPQKICTTEQKCTFPKNLVPPRGKKYPPENNFQIFL